MAIWDWIKGWVASNADQYVATPVPDADAGLDPAAPLIPSKSYFRVWLSDMFLARDKEWFTDRYPAVHCSVALSFGGQNATFTRVARPPEGMLGPGVRKHYPLSALMPYAGGIVEIDAGLLSVKGDQRVAVALDILGDFASLVSTPLAGALAIAGKVNAGLEKLLGSGADISLGYHEAFMSGGGSGANVLTPGYVAVVLESASKLSPADLSVIGGRLHRRSGQHAAPLTGCDYMLFHVESRQERDDWKFPDLDRLISEALRAQALGRMDDYEAFRNEALAKAVTSPDLTVPDRRRVSQAIREELGEVEERGLGATGDEVPGLEAIMSRRAIPLEAAAALPPITLSEVLG